MKDIKQKIALVGPTFPYRGGIAQYNTQLHHSLADICELTTLSFAKLYPKFLYPGATDIEHGAEGKKEPGVEYTIHVYKPWTLFRAAKAIEKSGAEVALLNWWTLIWQPGIAFLAWLLRKKGVKVVYICHNVFDHDGGGFKKKISKALLRFADGYIVHSTGDEKTLKSFYKKPILNTKVLPVYSQNTVRAKNITKRGRLELLFFGFIRPYKGLEDLVLALATLNDKKVYLTVAGEAWISAKELEEKIKSFGAPNIETRFEYVDEKEAARYFERADVVVLPYKQNTASAVAALAYNYKKPILATKVDGLSDAIMDGSTGWLVKPNSPDILAKKIGAITRKEAQSKNSGIEAFCKEHSWDALATQVANFAEEVSS